MENLEQNASNPELASLTIVRGTGLSLVGRITGGGLRYASQVLLARLLGPSSYGLYALGLAIYQVLEAVATMGLQHGAVRYTAIYYSQRDLERVYAVLRYALTLTLLVGGGLAVALYAFAPLLAGRLFGEPALSQLLRVFALGIPWGAAFWVAAMATTGALTTRYLVFARDFFHPLVFILVVVVLHHWLGLLGAAIAWPVATLLAFGISLYGVRRAFPAHSEQRSAVSSQLRAALLKFSAPLLIGELSWMVTLWTDVLMLGYFRPPNEVGFYRAASQTALPLTMMLLAINTIFGPTIAMLHHRKNWARLGQLFQLTTLWSFAIGLPGFLLIAIAGRELLQLFGREFSQAYEPLVILGLGQLVNAGTGSVGLMLMMGGRPYHFFWSDLALIFVNPVLNALLIPRWGMAGAALATGASLVGVNLVRLWLVFRLEGLQPYHRGYLKVLLVGAIAGAGTAYVYSLWAWQLHFLIALLLCAAVLGGLYLLGLWGFFAAEIRQVVHALLEPLCSSSRSPNKR
jgi:O-antigen/teichoic acid export membrane protein